MVLDLLLFDALRAVLPLVLVFLIVWFQTRSVRILPPPTSIGNILRDQFHHIANHTLCR
jgi:hypothetical protein